MKDRVDQKMDQWLKEEATNRIESTPEEFHAGFLQMLDSLPDHSESPAFQKRATTSKRLLVYATAAILIIGFITGTTVSPAFADWIKSFFTRPELDKGLQTAAQQGFSELQQASVTEQGITFTVKEVMADSKRLILTYSLQAEDGTTLDPATIFERVDQFYYTKDGNNFYITTDDGKIISQNKTFILPSGRMAKQQSIRRVLTHDDLADLVFDLEDHPPAKQLFVNMKLKKVNGVEGDWSLKVPVNLEKSMAATKRLPINAAYTTPSGLTIQLNDITFSPTVTTLALQSEWTAEKRRELEANHPEFFRDDNKKWFTQRWLHYDVVDESGKVVLSTTLPPKEKGNGILIEDHDDAGLSQSSRGSFSIVSQSYPPIETKKKLTFVLKGIAQDERPNLDWKINLKDLEKKNETFTYKSFRATITGIHYGENSSTLELEEETTLIGANIDILDESGRFLSAPNEDLRGEWDEIDPETRKRRLKLKIPVQGLTKETKSITLRFTGIVTFDPNVNWQVPLPPKP